MSNLFLRRWRHEKVGESLDIGPPFTFPNRWWRGCHRRVLCYRHICGKTVLDLARRPNML